MHVVQMTVDPNDPHCGSTKPIGPIYEEAKRVNWQEVPLDRKTRRPTFPSRSTKPRPTGIVEHDAITQLIDAESSLVICTGGGGISEKKIISRC